MAYLRKTKIVCTLGPATDSPDILKQLMKTGMNVARINFSHGTHEEHKIALEKVKETREKLDLPIALLLDTSGPEIRIKTFENDSIVLKGGDTFTLTADDIIGNEEKVSITYKNLPNEVTKGDRVLIDDGLIELKVLSIKENDIICSVENGGTVSNKKGVNLPGISLKLPFLSEKDKKDLLFGIENKFDFIAASFVRTATDVRDMKDFLQDNDGSQIRIIAKIENLDGYKNIDEIIQVSDGVMVARGDMGVEIPFEELPAIQKDIIHRCQITGKPVITATQMLDSMIRNPRPTRAEITDVANAVYDGTSAIMLSGETSIGKYPIEAVETMVKIATKTEKSINYIKKFTNTHEAIPRNVTTAIGHATCSTAHTLGAAAIISVTKSGYTARIISRFRPDSDIIATTTSRAVYMQLALSWGVTPLMSEDKSSTDEVFDHAIEQTLSTGIIKDGDLVILTGGPVGISGTTNTIKVHVVGNVIAQGKGINKYKASGNLCVIDEALEGISSFTAGDILVISRSNEKILPLLKSAAGLITEETESSSDAVIVGKALEIPVITEVNGATEILKSGTVATINAKDSSIYSGVH